MLRLVSFRIFPSLATAVSLRACSHQASMYRVPDSPILGHQVQIHIVKGSPSFSNSAGLQEAHAACQCLIPGQTRCKLDGPHDGHAVQTERSGSKHSPSIRKERKVSRRRRATEGSCPTQVRGLSKKVVDGCPDVRPSYRVLLCC